MPELDGIEATRRLHTALSETRVLILTTFDLNEYVYEAMRARRKRLPAEGCSERSTRSRRPHRRHRRRAPRTGAHPLCRYIELGEGEAGRFRWTAADRRP